MEIEDSPSHGARSVREASDSRVATQERLLEASGTQRGGCPRLGASIFTVQETAYRGRRPVVAMNAGRQLCSSGRQQAKHAQAHDFVRGRARTFVDFLSPRPRARVPFSTRPRVVRPTDDRKTILESVEPIEAAGCTADSHSLVERFRNSLRTRGVADNGDYRRVRRDSVSDDEPAGVCEDGGVTVSVGEIGGISCRHLAERLNAC